MAEGRALRSEDRLRALLSASQAVVEQSDLALVLRRIVEVAVDLVDAQYGAMGVISPEGDSLEQFVYAGIADEDAAAIGHLPEGHGLLGALITDPHPIRLDEIAGDPRAAGFPPHHPPMHSFLGVPVRVRGAVFGNLYLTNQRGGRFTAEDEQLVASLAVTAGFAIENARLLAEAHTRARWVTAAAELSAAILTTPTDTALDLVVTRVLAVSDADRVTLLVPDAAGEGLRVAAAAGDDGSALRGAVVHADSVFAGRVLGDGGVHAQPGARAGGGDPLLITREGASGPVLAVPLRNGPNFWGVLCLARRPDAQRFRPAEVDAAADLGSRASIALDLAAADEAAKRALLADDRRRIAQDLHDHVIQQLFGAGLGLQALAGRIGPGPDSDTLGETIDRLDDAIAQIRTVIFALSRRDEASLRHRVLDVVSELSSHSRRPPGVRFSGPVDLVVREGLATEVVAVARELLSNAIRHADADRVSIEVALIADEVSVVVEDDGRGIDPSEPRRGLGNLDDRAHRRHGSLAVESSPAGTVARWRVPVTPLTEDGRRSAG
jgi:signal transduction histidine kinase